MEERPHRGDTLAHLGHDGDVRGRYPLLEGVMGLLSIFLLSPGENLRSSDRAVAALRCRDLLEDIVLEPTTSSSPKVVWRRCLRSAIFGKACFVPFPCLSVAFEHSTTSTEASAWLFPCRGTGSSSFVTAEIKSKRDLA
jgi:hypothetical protein